MFNWLLTHSPLLYFTQSIWRDEAFSILVAQRPLSFIVGNLGFEPPLYYILLHYWIKLFGTSEVAVRSLSLVGFTLATILVIYWAEKLFHKHWLSWVLPLLFFFNPMLLYYAFEVRTYGWFMFFAVLSMYAYTQKKWLLLILANVLGFYTHSYMIFVPIAQSFHWMITELKIKTLFKTFLHSLTFRSLTASFLLMVPWFARIAKQAADLKSTWYFPVDGHLVKSVLGNLFIGYEGTPWYLWKFTFYLSLILLALFFLALKPQKTRRLTLFFSCMVFVPLTIVIGVSFFKPLFVNRYLIEVSIAEVFLVAFAIASIRHHALQKLLAFVLFLFSFSFNLWYPSQHAKVNIRKTLQEITMLADDDDIILAGSPLIFFESIYYSRTPQRVFLYNPKGVAFPHYVGDAIVSPSQMLRDLPMYPTRAFLVHEDGTFDVTFATPVMAKQLPAKKRY